MRVISHAVELSAGQFLEFGLGLCFVAFEFVVFEMIPHLFVRILVGRVTGKVEHVQARLGFDEGQGFL